MNKYKTELFDVTFNKPTGQEGEHVTITHRKHEDYLDMFDLVAVCKEVDILLQNGAIDAVEAIKIIRKAAAFFILGNTP